MKKDKKKKSFSDLDPLASGGATWFMAAVMLEVAVVSLAAFPSPHFLGLFLHRGPCFLRVLRSWEPAPFVAERKRPRFIRVGMVLYVWLIALHEWERGLVCEKRAMPHHSRSEVILEDSGRWSGFVLRRGEEARETHATECEEKTLK